MKVMVCRSGNTRLSEINYIVIRIIAWSMINHNKAVNISKCCTSSLHKKITAAIPNLDLTYAMSSGSFNVEGKNEIISIPITLQRDEKDLINSV